MVWWMAVLVSGAMHAMVWCHVANVKPLSADHSRHLTSGPICHGPARASFPFGYGAGALCLQGCCIIECPPQRHPCHPSRSAVSHAGNPLYMCPVDAEDKRNLLLFLFSFYCTRSPSDVPLTLR